MIESDIYLRLFRWVLGLFTFAFFSMILMWMIETRMMYMPWSYHLGRVQAGKVKDRMELSDRIALWRTTGGVGLHVRSGAALLPGLVQRIDYADDTHKAVLVAYGRSGSISLMTVLTQLGQYQGLNMARVDLSTGTVTPVDNYHGLQEVNLRPVAVFFPLHRTARVSLPGTGASLAVAPIFFSR